MEFFMRETIFAKRIRITETELAEYWGVKKKTLQNWRSAGIGPMYIKIGSRVIYTKDAVLEYEQTRTFRGPGERVTPTAQVANNGK
jgi:hypothetical protein